MTPSVYPTHKAVGRPMRFKGFQAQYIILAAGSLIGDLMIFITLYLGKLSPWICIAATFGLGAATLAFIAWLSRRFGTHGLMKHLAHKQLPRGLTCKNRRPFLNLLKRNV